MSITPAEFVLIVTGKASSELQQRFIREAEQSDSELRQMLRDAQKWASTKLNPNCTSSSGSGDATVETAGTSPGIIRRAAFLESQDDQSDVPATGKDLAEFIRGTASADTVARVKQALDDPSSEIWRLVEGLAEEDE